MSPKLILWLVFSVVSTAWFALDPDAGGPFFSAPNVVAVADSTPAQIPRIAGN
ncbi:MAG: hypothetical protein JZU52_05830 [Lamprocystis purpurea]|jgi:hypothetical protein|uniref:hypothetical protein n=1 Tax=Lamprocystis purpurea TaxID=61598 RepID=UPI00037DF3A1|nr:hypothetical protein [Lamprocystis purpurea]MBV5273164.1 hypothetical protein [Lamprocystis purpurea]